MVMTMYTSPCLGNEKDDGDYPSEDTLRIFGEPYDVHYDRSSEQHDKLERILVSCDPSIEEAAHRSQGLRSIRNLLYQGSK